MHFDQDSGRQGTEIEKFDGLGDDFLHPPPEGVVADYTLWRGAEIVGDQ